MLTRASITALLVLALIPGASFACIVDPSRFVQSRISEAFTEADAVVIAEVVDSEELGPSWQRVMVRPSETLKGPVASTIDIARNVGSMCPHPAQLGETYLFILWERASVPAFRFNGKWFNIPEANWENQYILYGAIQIEAASDLLPQLREAP